MGRKSGKRKAKELPPPPEEEYEEFIPACVRDEDSAEEEKLIEQMKQQEEADKLKNEEIRMKKRAKSKQKKKRHQQREEVHLPSQEEQERTNENAKIKELFAPNDLAIYEVENGADSLYISLAHQCSVAGMNLSPEELRTKVVKQLQRAPHQYFHFLPDQNGSINHRKQQISQMKDQVQKGSYGGEMEITALSFVLKRPIHVYSASGVTQYDEIPSGKSPLSISCHEKQHAFGKHYNSLVAPPSSTPLEEESSQSQEEECSTEEEETTPPMDGDEDEDEDDVNVDQSSVWPSLPTIKQELTEEEIRDHLFYQVPFPRKPIAPVASENPAEDRFFSRSSSFLEKSKRRLRVESATQARESARYYSNLLHNLRTHTPNERSRIEDAERATYEYSDVAYQITRHEQESSQQDPDNYKIDLHYLYRYQADEWVDDLLEQFSFGAPGAIPRYLTIVTGVGHHSSTGRSVLQKELILKLNARNITFSRPNNEGEFWISLDQLRSHK